MISIKAYFGEILKQDAGDKVIIPCSNESEQESTRVQLFKIRRKYSEIDSTVLQTIGIYKMKMAEKPVVVLEKRGGSDALGFVIKKDGSYIPIEEETKETSSNLERIISKAIEDGLDLTEIIDSLEGVYSQDEIINEVLRQRPDLGGSEEDERTQHSGDDNEARHPDR